MRGGVCQYVAQETLQVDAEIDKKDHLWMGTMKKRCPWATTDPLYIDYHDTEWGVPLHDDAKLFEFLVLEGAQAGLSWITVLKKRAAYRQVFDGFDPVKIARYDSAKREELLGCAGIIRNRLKIEASIKNARAFLAVQNEFGSFDSYIWRFVNGKPRENGWTDLKQVPRRPTYRLP